jgi:hypothetical protein
VVELQVPPGFISESLSVTATVTVRLSFKLHRRSLSEFGSQALRLPVSKQRFRLSFQLEVACVTVRVPVKSYSNYWPRARGALALAQSGSHRDRDSASHGESSVTVAQCQWS